MSGMHQVFMNRPKAVVAEAGLWYARGTKGLHRYLAEGFQQVSLMPRIVSLVVSGSKL